MIKYCFVCIFIVFTATALEWHQRKHKHVLRSTSEEELSYWAGLSNSVLFNDTLDPIAIPRVPGTRAHKAVREFIQGSMEALQWNVKLDSFMDRTPVGDMKFSNIIATFNDSAPRHLVLACHYDSKMDREKALVLATDSAVPCAMLIYLAKILDSHLRLPRSNAEDLSLRFIFFDGEEAFVRWSDQDSLYGARHLAKALERKKYPRHQMTTHLHRMDVLVLLDLLGSPNPTFYSYFEETRELFSNLIEIENALKNLGLLSNHSQNYFVNKVFYGGVEDDHIPFLQRGVRILHLIPQPFPKVWHTEMDTVDNLDFPTIENLNKMLTVFVVEYLHLPLGQHLL